MNIGAAHTSEVADALKQKDIPYAVVSPSSLSLESGDGSLSLEAFDRKLRGQSVDPANGIGAFVDGRRKPPPSIENRWLKAKAQLHYAAVVIARAAATAGSGPPDLGQVELGLGGSGPASPEIAIDMATARLSPRAGDDGRNDILFQVTLLNQNRTFWVRAGAFDTPEPLDAADPQTLERALESIVPELDVEPPVDEAAPPAQSPINISPDVKVRIAENVDDLNQGLI
jgi:hypothetical protein